MSFWYITSNNNVSRHESLMVRSTPIMNFILQYTCVYNIWICTCIILCAFNMLLVFNHDQANCINLHALYYGDGRASDVHVVVERAKKSAKHTCHEACGCINHIYIYQVYFIDIVYPGRPQLFDPSLSCLRLKWIWSAIASPHRSTRHPPSRSLGMKRIQNDIGGMSDPQI